MAEQLWENIEQAQLKHRLGLDIRTSDNVTGGAQRRSENDNIVALVHHWNNTRDNIRLKVK